MKQQNLSRRLLFVLISLLALQLTVNAQTLKDFFSSSETPTFYYGLDFTKARLIDDATANVNDIRDRQYDGINELIITESKKYDLKGAFHKSNVDHDLGYVNKRNEKANAEDIKSTSSSDFHRFKEDDIKSIVSGFDFGGKKAIGILLVVEAMSKSEKSIAVWVTLVDPQTKKVLLTDRVEGKAGMAFGFRNYWASAIKNVLETIEKKKYNEWKSKYGS